VFNAYFSTEQTYSYNHILVLHIYKSTLDLYELYYTDRKYENVKCYMYAL